MVKRVDQPREDLNSLTYTGYVEQIEVRFVSPWVFPAATSYSMVPISQTRDDKQPASLCRLIGERGERGPAHLTFGVAHPSHWPRPSIHLPDLRQMR